MLPNYLLVGTQKSGTTALAFYLHHHDQIFRNKPHKIRRFPYPLVDREIHFFDKERNFKKGLEWYEQHFEGADKYPVIIEKTPDYSCHPEALYRIHKSLPEVKLIWIFRNPIDRAYSQYQQHIRAGVERRSFEESIRRQIASAGSCSWDTYIKRSLYYEQVERYLELFSIDRMHFILFEELKRNPEKVLSSLFNFLRVDNRPEIAKIKTEKNEGGAMPRYVLLQYAIRKIFRRTLPFQIVRRFNRSPEKKYPPMRSETRLQLEKFFEVPNQKLAVLTGLDTSCWSASGKNVNDRAHKLILNGSISTLSA